MITFYPEIKQVHIAAALSSGAFFGLRALALLGGMLAANWELGLSFAQFLDRFPRAVKLVHLWVGLGKSAVFGLLIGLIGCHFGLTAPPSSEGLGRATTRAVVLSISALVLADMLFSFFLNR